ncbi:glycoside hydrolase family protein [Spirochaetia bacterium]|nr:glycoside hydrolase family protein [Spirochaetia bacterium]
MTKPVISIVLNAHIPFAGLWPAGQRTFGPQLPPTPFSAEESWFFEAISETYLPLLEVFDHLDADHIPFRLGMVMSPILCHMLKDETLIACYLEYVDRQLEFGVRELERTAGEPAIHALAKYCYDRVVDKRILFTERYEGDLLKVMDRYQKKGRLELLTTAAGYAFLPLYTAYPEAVQAQFEAAIASHRRYFGRKPQGFWLPELGWAPELDGYLRAYGFSYTVTDTHSVLFEDAGPGSFYPIRTPSQVLVLIRDYYAGRDLAESETGYCASPEYRDYYEDPGYELPIDTIRSFLGAQGERTPTGYKYHCQRESTGNGPRRIYDPETAQKTAREHAGAFLENRRVRLNQAAALMDGTPISLCAFDADRFGRFWHEGPVFLETLFREGAGREGLLFMTPSEYLSRQNMADIETALPEYSSGGFNGYAETWVDAANDWMYPHAARALERMVALAERFPNERGLKERALNQAAREILLVQSADWPRMLYLRESADFARHQIEMALRNFTTIYEALASNYISTEWLTSLERRHNLFPGINYRVFRRKQ